MERKAEGREMKGRRRATRGRERSEVKVLFNAHLHHFVCLHFQSCVVEHVSTALLKEAFATVLTMIC
eukprot:6186392-Pleurochrysis_carterae.AAC.4